MRYVWDFKPFFLFLMKMKEVKDVNYYCGKYPEDYEKFKGDLGCIWCYKIVSIEDATSHIADPMHLDNKKRGFF